MNDSQLKTKKLITVRPLDSVEGAIKLRRRRGVRHLLVMNRTRLVVASSPKIGLLRRIHG